MSRNRYDVDETLERHIDFSKLGRIGKYIKPHLREMALSLVFIALASVCSLFIPTILQRVIDEVIPRGSEGVRDLVVLTCFAVAAILFSTLFSTLRSVIMARVGQTVVYDIRRDLYAHLQDLPFDYYDSRPHGKIWYYAGKFLYVPCALILCLVALFMKIAF